MKMEWFGGLGRGEGGGGCSFDTCLHVTRDEV